MAESRFASQQSQPGEWGRGNRISSFPSSASKILAQQSLLIGFKSKLRGCQAAIRCQYIFIFCSCSVIVRVSVVLKRTVGDSD